MSDKCKWYICDKKSDINSKHYPFCSYNCINTARVTRRRKEIKQKAIEYKGGKCVICGYNKCNRALHFHHIDPNEKDFTVSHFADRMAWSKIKIELDKCVLLCSNCHAEEHQLHQDKIMHDCLDYLPRRQPKKIANCSNCNKQLSGYKYDKCAKCFRESTQKIKISYEEVLLMIEETNMNQTANKLGVSWNGLNKFLNRNKNN